MMGLYLRMALYLIFGVLAGQGLVVFDQAAGTVTFRIDDLVLLLISLGGFVLTFLGSRAVKAAGGRT